MEIKLSYNQFSKDFKAVLNGQILSDNMYFGFYRLKTNAFENEYGSFPDYAYQSAGTSQYSICFEGTTVYARIMETVFAGYSFTATAPIISPENRLEWLTELCSKSNIAQRHELKIKARSVNSHSFQLSQSATLNLKIVAAGADVVFVQTVNDFANITHDQGRADGFTAVVYFGGTGWSVKQVQDTFVLIECNPAVLEEFLKQWYLDILLPFAINDNKAKIKVCGTVRNDTLLSEKTRMLTDSKPYVGISAPQRIELSNQAQRFSLVKLPDNMPVTVSVSVTNVIDIDKQLRIIPKGIGQCVLSVCSTVDKTCNASCRIEIYRSNPVRDIILRVADKSPVEGQSIKARIEYIPPNADNKAAAVFSTTNPKIMSILSKNGIECYFSAMKAGDCTITASANGFTKSEVIRVAPMASGLKLSEHNISLKLNNMSHIIKVDVLPKGAQGWRVEARSSDPGIVDVNNTNGALTPVSEGTAVVNFDLRSILDGRLIVSDQCKVEITPIHETITPDVYMLVEFFCIIARPFLNKYIDCVSMAVICAVLSGISCWHIKKRWAFMINAILFIGMLFVWFSL